MFDKKLLQYDSVCSHVFFFCVCACRFVPVFMYLYIRTLHQSYARTIACLIGNECAGKRVSSGMLLLKPVADSKIPHPKIGGR